MLKGGTTKKAPPGVWCRKYFSSSSTSGYSEMSTETMKHTPNERKDSVTINETSLPTGIIFKNMNLVNNANLWHKFCIKNCDNLSRDALLGAVLDHVHPFDMIPVLFTWEKNQEASFLARNCGAALQKLCNDNLVVPNPVNLTRPLKLSIILRYSTTTDFTVNVQRNIVTILNKRYNPLKKILDLAKFKDDPDINEFCPLSQPKIMYFVLHLSKNLSPKPEAYILSNNRIKTLKPLDVLKKATNSLYLDISNNMIANIESLQSLQLLNVQELSLTGNPICKEFNYETYLNKVKQHCTTLQKLDGIQLVEDGIPVQRRNFLCDINQVNFVSDFLEKFFTIYDSTHRRLLEDMYHNNALFSLNTTYLHGQVTSFTSDLRKYNNIARNFKKLADMSRNKEFLFRGKADIINVINGLPLTEHDPFSFKVDLTLLTPTSAVIGVNGVFRERPDNLLASEKCFGFKRTFVLQTLNNDVRTYIVNDMIHLHNAFSYQATEGFKVTRRPEPKNLLTEKKCQEIAESFRKLTTLNLEWSKKCLEESKYNIKEALGLFVDLYKADRIPKEAFEKI